MFHVERRLPWTRLPDLEQMFHVEHPGGFLTLGNLI
jgi:hypothetical protein